MLQVWRVAPILLLACFLLLGSGVMEWLHNQEHAREDAAIAAAASLAKAGKAELIAVSHHNGHDHAGHGHHHYGDHEDAGSTGDDRSPVPPAKHHDANNCAEHAQLHMPMLSVGYVPLLVCLGLFVAFLTQVAPAPVSRAIPRRIHCRGPPAC